MPRHLRTTLVWSILAALAVSGCHTMRFEIEDAKHDKVVHERKSYFFWGLYPTQEIDVSERCPAGVAAIREQTSFTDGLYTVLFLGIWELRSSWYYCLPEYTRARR